MTKKPKLADERERWVYNYSHEFFMPNYHPKVYRQDKATLKSLAKKLSLKEITLLNKMLQHTRGQGIITGRQEQQRIVSNNLFRAA